MIKINDNWIDETLIVHLAKQTKKDYDSKEEHYFMQVNTGRGYYDINFYSNKELRDVEFDNLGKLVSERDKNKKDYIQGFKDGTEYALKLKDK